MTKSTLPKAINWHFEPRCNYRCKFCFAHFVDHKQIIDFYPPTLFKQLIDRGVEKITFVGGEPMLDHRITSMIKQAAATGLITCIVTNGTRVTRDWLENVSGYLHWLGLSIDASNDELHAKMGRGRAGEIKTGTSNHLSRSLKIWKDAQSLGFGLKLNTVVSKINEYDDMTELIEMLQPDRWKVFQVLPVKGENDNVWDEIKISSSLFQRWVARHKHLSPVVESNELMRGSYCMLDSELRFFSNESGEVRYGRSITDVGIDKAWDDIYDDFDSDRFNNRGGQWEW